VKLAVFASMLRLPWAVGMGIPMGVPMGIGMGWYGYWDCDEYPWVEP